MWYRHWNEFIQKEDLQKLSQSGITHLRIPLGYWIFSVEENEPFPEPPKNDHHAQRYYLKRLVRWAEELELKVILDLHGAPGSQNGFDNSGRMGPIGRKYTFTFIFLYFIRPFKKHSTIVSIQYSAFNLG